jgi:hypothetical protein
MIGSAVRYGTAAISSGTDDRAGAPGREHRAVDRSGISGAEHVGGEGRHRAEPAAIAQRDQRDRDEQQPELVGRRQQREGDRLQQEHRHEARATARSGRTSFPRTADRLH